MARSRATRSLPTASAEADRDYVRIANDYARDVLSGRTLACRLVKLACQRHLDDLDRARAANWPYEFSSWHARDVCGFAEKLPHIEGRWETPTISLEPWQVFCLAVIFGWRRREDEGRRFSKVYWEVGRKNAKSTIAAVVALYCFTCEAEPAPYVFIGATTGAQALKVFHPARMMALRTPALCQAFDIRLWAKSLTVADGGYIQTINSKGQTQDGHNPHLVVLDELHAHKDRALYDVMDSAMGARSNPLMWIITTAGFDTNGVCYEQRAFAKQVLEGIVQADHYFGIIYTLDDEEVEAARNGDLRPDSWIKANPNLGVSVKLASLEAAAAEALAQPGKLAEFLTKRLNVWTSARAAHINVQRWKACNGPVDLEALRTVPCFAGYDLGSTSDLTAFRLTWRMDGRLKTWGLRYVPEAAVQPRTKKNGVPYGRWVTQRPAGTWDAGSDIGLRLAERRLLTVTPGDTTDWEFIETDIRWAMSVFNIKAIGFDSWRAQDLNNRLLVEGAPLIQVVQGHKTLSAPFDELDRLYLKGLLDHAGDEVLNWCASNVVARPDANNNLIPSKTKSLEKIDDYAALLNAVTVGASRTEELPSVYESRGLTVL